MASAVDVAATAAESVADVEVTAVAAEVTVADSVVAVVEVA